MQRSDIPWFFLILVACAAAFVWLTGRLLPAVVASHFGITGAADGFMPRDAYVRFYMILIVLFPLAVVFLPAFSLRGPRARINLPHREYWLAPARRAETVQYLHRQMIHFGSVLTVFLCYVHWLLVRANALKPPVLSSSWFIGGLVVLLASVAVRTIVLIRYFRNVPE